MWSRPPANAKPRSRSSRGTSESPNLPSVIGSTRPTIEASTALRAENGSDELRQATKRIRLHEETRTWCVSVWLPVSAKMVPRCCYAQRLGDFAFDDFACAINGDDPPYGSNSMPMSYPIETSSPARTVALGETAGPTRPLKSEMASSDKGGLDAHRNSRSNSTAQHTDRVICDVCVSWDQLLGLGPRIEPRVS